MPKTNIMKLEPEPSNRSQVEVQKLREKFFSSTGDVYESRFIYKKIKILLNITPSGWKHVFFQAVDNGRDRFTVTLNLHTESS